MLGQTPSHAYDAKNGSGVELNSITFLDLFIEHYEEILNDVVSAALTENKTALQEQAEKIEAWSKMASHLDVEYKEGQVNYLFTPQENADVTDFVNTEYGSPDTPAAPLIRSFAAKSADPLAQRIEKGLREYSL